MTEHQGSESGVGEDSLHAEVLEELQLRRFSCRWFLSTPVPHKTIERLLGMAQRAASWCNAQPWQIHITEGTGTERFRSELYQHALADMQKNQGKLVGAPDITFPAAYTGAYKRRRQEVGLQLYESVGVANDRVASGQQALENFRFFGAPHVMIISSERDLGVYGAIDCGIYMANLQLAAESLRLGMVLQAAIAMYSPFVRAHIGLPENRIIVAGASFGYVDDQHPANQFRSHRAKLGEVVHWVSE